VAAVCVHFAYERLATPRRSSCPVPTSAIFTIKKLNTEFTLSLDGLVGKTPFHGRAAGTDIIIAAVAAAILRRRVASDVAGGGCVRRSGSRSPFRQEFALLR